MEIIASITLHFQSTMSNANLRKRQSRLFSTLASVDATDASASKRRRKSQEKSLRQSKCAADQAKLNGVLLELRILTQRCLTESDAATADANVGESPLGDVGKAREEVDALLENLLVARRELMGHQLGDADGSEGDEGSDDDDDEKKGVDYATLINQSKKDGDETSSDEDSSSGADDGSGGDNLAKQLQSEYASLRGHWKKTLNKHHSNLALHSGMAVNTSKFQSRAVDVSFWEQVANAQEHERFKRGTSSQNSLAEGDNGANELQFDDSKLYQQMLKDFIASSQSSKTNKRGVAVDPAQEAAERLKRAVRKKSGDTGDVDLTSLLTDVPASADGLASQNAAKKKVNTVDRRASKGRKIRYTVHPKLVNFTFPVARPEPVIGDDVWFKSLFGGVGRL